ncbi:hypothetical protein SAMN05216404_106220 [Nitrosospira multiformis]|uniref:Uncharacterized protein n=1 Tax=Nitrosospira multiformis TaxID=1231 RepID=A0A1H8IZ49_9PROT|nr:hypothetical protein SAMN05216404_106220 [Nitrosospira multiformis]
MSERLIEQVAKPNPKSTIDSSQIVGVDPDVPMIAFSVRAFFAFNL